MLQSTRTRFAARGLLGAATPRLLHSRSEAVGGPGGAFSMTRDVTLAAEGEEPSTRTRTPVALKQLFRLDAQKRADGDRRTRAYYICKECGRTTQTVNFDAMPSSTIGLYGTCRDGRDYTHHKFKAVAAAQYERLNEEEDPEARLTMWRYGETE